MLKRTAYERWQEFSYYAGKHKMGTDMVYLARINKEKLGERQDDILRMLSSGGFDKETFYIVEDEFLEQVVGVINPGVDFVSKIDGFNVLAPNWKSPIKK